MKAIVLKKYGKPESLKYLDVDKPVPKEDELLLKLSATTVTAGDCELRTLNFQFPINLLIRIFFGFFRPRSIILGQEYSGTVEMVGSDVTSFKAGDQVFGATDLKFGAYAEYLCVKEKSVVTEKPQNMSFEEAAGVPVGGLEALHFLKLANIEKGTKLLINGAGGSIGTAAIQLAKHYGAEVTVVDALEKLDMLKFAGADHLIDYKTQNFTDLDKKYDVVFDVVGKCSYYKTLDTLNEKGRYIIANPRRFDRRRGKKTNRGDQYKVILETTNRYKKDLIELKELVEAGKLITLIDTYYPLKDIPEAHRYVDTGMKKGNLIITIDHD